jgi:hypothetical protein
MRLESIEGSRQGNWRKAFLHFCSKPCRCLLTAVEFFSPTHPPVGLVFLLAVFFFVGGAALPLVV